MTRHFRVMVWLVLGATIGTSLLPWAAVAASEEDCGFSAGGYEYELPWTGTDPAAYLVVHRGVPGDPMFTVILYVESNGMYGLQRYDSLCDGTSGGTIEPDTRLFEGIFADVG